MQSIMHFKYLTLWLECLQLQSPSEPASLLHMLQKKQELRFALLAAQLDYLTYRPTYMMLTMRHNLQQDLHIWWWFIPSKYSLQLPNCSKLYKVDARTYNIATWGEPDMLLHSTESPYQVVFYIYHHCLLDAAEIILDSTGCITSACPLWEKLQWLPSPEGWTSLLYKAGHLQRQPNFQGMGVISAVLYHWDHQTSSL